MLIILFKMISSVNVNWVNQSMQYFKINLYAYNSPADIECYYLLHTLLLHYSLLLNISFSGNSFQPYLNIETDKCEATLRWSHQIIDLRLITENLVIRYSRRINGWVNEDTTSVGIATQFTFSQCILQPGRLYEFKIRTNVSLTDPYETLNFYSNSRNVIMGVYWYILLNVGFYKG